MTKWNKSAKRLSKKELNDILDEWLTDYEKTHLDDAANDAKDFEEFRSETSTYMKLCSYNDADARARCIETWLSHSDNTTESIPGYRIAEAEANTFTYNQLIKLADITERGKQVKEKHVGIRSLLSIAININRLHNIDNETELAAHCEKLGTRFALRLISLGEPAQLLAPSPKELGLVMPNSFPLRLRLVKQLVTNLLIYNCKLKRFNLSLDECLRRDREDVELWQC